jgi:hypothetical protein
MRQSDSARSMTKSGGGKMGAARRAGRSRADQDKQGGAGGDDDVTRLAAEAERLREALASEQERARKLEAANATVVARLSKAIASIRQLLERQG